MTHRHVIRLDDVLGEITECANHLYEGTRQDIDTGESTLTSEEEEKAAVVLTAKCAEYVSLRLNKGSQS